MEHLNYTALNVSERNHSNLEKQLLLIYNSVNNSLKGQQISIVWQTWKSCLHILNNYHTTHFLTIICLYISSQTSILVLVHTHTCKVTPMKKEMQIVTSLHVRNTCCYFVLKFTILDPHSMYIYKVGKCTKKE